MKLLMLVSNTFENDARVHRCASALAEEGYEVVLLARHREGLPERERVAGYEVVRMRLIAKEDPPTPKVSSQGPKERPHPKPRPRPSLLRSVGRRAWKLLLPLRSLAWWGLRKFDALQKKRRQAKSRWKWFSRTWAHAAFQRRKLRLFGYTRLVQEHAEEIAPDLIHAHDFHCLVAAHEIWKEKKIPYVYDSHELWVERNRLDGEIPPAERAWETELEREAISRAAFSITVCDSIADDLARRYAIPRPIVVRNTPVRRNGAHGEGRSLRKALGIRDSDFVVLYLGKVTYHRGVTDILHAVPMLEPRVKFVTLGYFDPRFREEFDRLVKELGIADRVYSFGPVNVDEVADWIVDCDLSLTTMNRVCLSYVYALPNKLFESLQAGLPIVGPDSPEIENILQRYACGITYRDTDSGDLAGKILSLMRDPERIASYRAGARRAGEELCWENEKGHLLAGYRAFLPLSRTRTPESRPVAELGASKE